VQAVVEPTVGPPSCAFDCNMSLWRLQRTCGGCPEPSSCGRGSARSSPHSRGLKLLRLAARSSLAFLAQLTLIALVSLWDVSATLGLLRCKL
jgi:hypothetical protein